MKSPRPTFVYLIEAQSGLLKIGVSKAPRTREVLINQHSPVPARLIACWPGDWRAERELHDRFEGHRSHNEWFLIRGSLEQFVAQKRGVGVEIIPDWAGITQAAVGGRRLSTRERMSMAAKARWADPAFRRRCWIDNRVRREGPCPSGVTFDDWMARRADAERRAAAEYDLRVPSKIPTEGKAA